MTLLYRIAEQTGLDTLCCRAEVKVLVCLDANFPHCYIVVLHIRQLTLVYEN